MNDIAFVIHKALWVEYHVLRNQWPEALDKAKCVEMDCVLTFILTQEQLTSIQDFILLLANDRKDFTLHVFQDKQLDLPNVNLDLE